MHIHHIGYLVKKLPKAAEEFEKLGYVRCGGVTADPVRKTDILFLEKDGYVVELHFLTDEENGGSADIFRAVLGTMELHFSEKEAGGSSSSGGA